MKSALPVIATGVVVVALGLLAPLREISGDTVPNRYGAALLACGGSYDLSRIAWLDQGPLPYWAVRRGEAIVSVFGPAPPTVAALAYAGIGSVDATALKTRARVVAAILVAVATCLLVVAISAQRSLRCSVGFGLVAALSFAGLATLGQGLWQQTVALPVLMGAVATFAWRERRPRLVVATPALLLVAVLMRPTIAPLGIGVGVAWCVERRTARTYAIAASIALLLALPFVLWNQSHLGAPLPTGQLSANAAVSDHIFVLSRAQLGYGLGGLLGSPGRGLLWFAPIAIVAAGYAFRRGARVERALAAALVAQLVTMACFHMWWGGICFGPRFLSEVVWVAIWMASMQPVRKAVIVPAISITVVVGALGLFAWRAEQWETRRNPDIDPNALWDVADSPLTSLFRDASDQLHALEAIGEPPSVTCDDGRLR